MGEEMLQDLGIVIHSSGREICNATISPTLSSSEDDISVFWESDSIAAYFRDYMDHRWKEKVSRVAVCTLSIPPIPTIQDALL